MKLIITIVDRGNGDEVVKIYEEGKVAFQMICLGKGTANSEILDLLGIGETEKDVVFSFADDDEIKIIFDKLYNQLNFKKHGTGVAFTIPIDSISKKTLDLLLDKMEDYHG